jgi:hypothetical protein
LTEISPIITTILATILSFFYLKIFASTLPGFTTTNTCSSFVKIVSTTVILPTITLYFLAVFVNCPLFFTIAGRVSTSPIHLLSFNITIPCTAVLIEPTIASAFLLFAIPLQTGVIPVNIVVVTSVSKVVNAFRQVIKVNGLGQGILKGNRLTGWTDRSLRNTHGYLKGSALTIKLTYGTSVPAAIDRTTSLIASARTRISPAGGTASSLNTAGGYYSRRKCLVGFAFNGRCSDTITGVASTVTATISTILYFLFFHIGSVIARTTRTAPVMTVPSFIDVVVFTVGSAPATAPVRTTFSPVNPFGFFITGNARTTLNDLLSLKGIARTTIVIAVISVTTLLFFALPFSARIIPVNIIVVASIIVVVITDWSPPPPPIISCFCLIKIQ